MYLEWATLKGGPSGNFTKKGNRWLNLKWYFHFRPIFKKDPKTLFIFYHLDEILRNRDILFDDGTKMENPSEIYPPLSFTQSWTPDSLPKFKTRALSIYTLSVK
jgi:hypothetical protein